MWLSYIILYPYIGVIRNFDILKKVFTLITKNSFSTDSYVTVIHNYISLHSFLNLGQISCNCVGAHTRTKTTDLVAVTRIFLLTGGGCKGDISPM